MRVADKNKRLVILCTLLLLVVPTVLLPFRLNLDPIKLSAFIVLGELFYYVVMTYFLNDRMSGNNLLKAVGFSIFYRIIVGAITGLLFAAIYSLSITGSLILGLWSYLPALMLHVVATPFILRAVFGDLFKVKRAVVTIQTASGESAMPERSRPSSRPQEFGTPQIFTTSSDDSRSNRGHQPPSGHRVASDTNGFERAVRYVGEQNTVLLALVVDYEGLPLANVNRGGYNPEDWSPLALLLFETSAQTIGRIGLDGIEKVDLHLENMRLMAVRDRFCTLLVLSERQTDDLLSIRIRQAMDMIGKYVQDRYHIQEDVTPERSYVSSAQ